MIPQVTEYLKADFVFAELPSKTFQIDFQNKKRISGWIDGLEAVKQSIYMILNTERYGNLIHSWDYGVELQGLIGKPLSFCLPELPRRITEALMQDTRVKGVSDFKFDVQKSRVQTTFTVDTIFGALEMKKGVEI